MNYIYKGQIIKRKEDIMDISNVFLPKKRHFRETEEWRIKKKRVLTKMRALTKINLLLVLSKMSRTSNECVFKKASLGERSKSYQK
ncbi:hypothetical protein NECAME_09314 [Necator americanus]|uniref:Uncharacterized protein n=1 Tax=Necator americanus TaxID=51031 RepID=W2TF45_NECAM|nr:hypothetical protein NECAME_09314 [Necator americanus]ETN80219.1 hypothetical protein NECAME_09314 [Necator americanus]